MLRQNDTPIHAIRKQAELGLTLLRDLETAVAPGQPLDQYLAHYYRQHREFGSRDRRFFSALAFAWFRWRGWLPNHETPDALICILAWLLDAPDTHPAIEYLANNLPPPHPPFQALGSMPMSEKAKVLGQWLQRPPSDVEALVPSWFAKALFYPDAADQSAHLNRCLQAFQVRPPTWLRTRTGSAPDILAELKNHNISASLHSRLAEAVCLPTGANQEILHMLPDVEIQDLASQCVGLVCAPGAGEHWWDVCAGSGGKSFHLAALMNNTGSILATDIRDGILKECRRRMARNRARILDIRKWNGTAATAPDRLFDGVLVDAPCSGIGTWHRNPDARWRTPADSISRHAEIQLNLLNLCANKVRPGGRLVYAVCTLTTAETVGVMEDFLAGRQDFHLESAPHPLTGESTTGLIRIWPWDGNCNGMFIASLKKP